MIKKKIREINLIGNSQSFSIFKRKNYSKKSFDFEGISSLRKLLSNEKARILHVLKNEKPESIYLLAKILNRDFKGVYSDLKMLERFGFIGFVREKKKGRVRYRPELIIEELTINIKL